MHTHNKLQVGRFPSGLEYIMSADGNNDSTSESSEVRIREDILNENEEPVSITVQDDHLQKHDEHHKKHKVDIVLKATANAPIMKKRKWTVDGERTIGWIINFIKKYLLMEPGDSLFLYVNQSFAPSPDQVLRNLYECFGTDGKLILHYCKTQAWG